ncbi:MAG: PQQ-binding-like beta-propeller repeat protein [Candidatus Pacebacteria bacterium]|nr:PQQ-binding-like beta-propeller repeat protein [Candidatus Paceibacterota bacterium]MCD8508193.1 PQQ-binding-like beta-propeller repeat protein [Candidatus Paceibacterota bacterium]MCD8528175.1 PQQ-binding-like beta-propeller repeat protein [Candidatus Paceibacterota bacterium]MCD8563444.1 PQQ-binding-like beta-propeller repeat protein [Candidatus Paceibacterota bacterium]
MKIRRHETFSWNHALWTCLALGVGVFLAYGITYTPSLIATAREQSYTLPPLSLEDVRGDIVLGEPPALFVETVPDLIGYVFRQEKTRGLLTFRGNDTRTWYGTGPVSHDMAQIWSYPERPMCSYSTALGETKEWCGTGWTGQPLVWERPDGITEVIFGAYDGAVHFVNGATGKPLRHPFPTRDIIKGTGTLDPDGYPLLYIGSRDNYMRILALDTQEVRELWSVDARTLGGIWNDDWDASPLIHDGIMYQGGENSHFYAFELHRTYDAEGFISVHPKMILDIPTYDAEWIARAGDRNFSIENSPVRFEDRVYFANSAGRIMGIDIRRIRQGSAPVVFDFWVGDDIDATLIVDDEGMLYVALEKERFNERSREVGQLIKINPYSDNDPILWRHHVPGPTPSAIGGIWATPALHQGYVYVPTHKGELWVIHAKTGERVFTDTLTPHAWSSPIIVDQTLLVGMCNGYMRMYDVRIPHAPRMVRDIRIGRGGCIESTPAWWNGRMYIGSRDGFVYGFE